MDEKIQEELTLVYLRCPQCKETLLEYREREEIKGYVIDNFLYFQCPQCRKKYFGYEYEIIDNKIKNFKLLEKKR